MKMTKSQFIKWAKAVAAKFKNHKYIAVDKNGGVYAYSEEPLSCDGNHYWFSRSGSRSPIYIGRISGDFIKEEWSTILVSSGAPKCCTLKEYRKWAESLMKLVPMYRYIAMDVDGTVYAYSNKPKYSSSAFSYSGWVIDDGCGRGYKLEYMSSPAFTSKESLVRQVKASK